MTIALKVLLFSIALAAFQGLALGSFGNVPPLPWYFNSGSQMVFHGDTMVYENYVGKKNIEYNASFSCKLQFQCEHLYVS